MNEYQYMLQHQIRIREIERQRKQSQGVTYKKILKSRIRANKKRMTLLVAVIKT